MHFRRVYCSSCAFCSKLGVLKNLSLSSNSLDLTLSRLCRLLLLSLCSDPMFPDDRSTTLVSSYWSLRPLDENRPSSLAMSRVHETRQSVIRLLRYSSTCQFCRINYRTMWSDSPCLNASCMTTCARLLALLQLTRNCFYAIRGRGDVACEKMLH